MRFSIFAIVFAISTVSFSAAQAQPDCKTSSVLVSVVDAESEFIPSLSPERFEVKVGGKAAHVDTVSPGVPANVVLFLDSNPRLVARRDMREFQLRMAYHLITAAPETTRTAMVVYGDKIEVVLQDRKAIQQELLARLSGNDPKSGKPTLVPTLQFIISKLGTTAPGDVLVALTGDDEEYATESSALRDALLDRRLRLFAVRLETAFSQAMAGKGNTIGGFSKGLYSAPGSDQANQIAQNNPGEYQGDTMKQRREAWDHDTTIQRLSGGDGLHVNFDPRLPKPNAADWKQRLVSVMYRFYTLNLNLPVALQKPTSVETVVLTPEGKRAKDLFPHAQTLLQPCTVKNAK